MACRFPGHLPVGDIATCASLQIADEVRAKGRCDRTLDEIGARGSLSTVRNAMRAAVQLGLVRVTERPQPGRKNLPNVVEVVSPEWRIWMTAARSRAVIGFKKLIATDTKVEKRLSK